MASASLPPPPVDADLLPQAVLVLDEHNFIRNGNRTWGSLYAHDVARCLGRSLFQYIHPKDRPHARDALEKIWETGVVSSCVVRILDGGSAERWSELHMRCHGVDGKPFATVSITDINERVGEERQLLAHHRSINGMLNDLPGMVYRCRNNPEWPMEYVSEGCVELTGYQARDIIQSRKLSYGSMIIGEDKDHVWEEVQNALREHRRFELTYRIRTARDEIKWVWEKGKGIYSAEGELTGIEGFITDFCRQVAFSRMRDGSAPGDYLLSGTQFSSRLAEALEALGRDGDLRVLLFCIHLDRFERYMAGVGYEKLTRAQSHIGTTLRSVTDPADVLYASQPNRWFIMQRRPAADVDVEGSAETIGDAFLAPVSLGDRQIYVGTSIGCVVVSDGAGVDARRAIRRASRAMSTCHAAGGAVEAVYI